MALECPPGGTIKVRDVVEELNVKAIRDMWHYYYYADEDLDRVIGMDPVTMTQMNTIKLASTGANAGSVDRAGYTDKMYVRTAGYDHLEVLDAVAGKSIGSIPLIHHPRSSGGYNRYRGLQVISTKVEPYAQVIDVATDRVVITVGSDHTTETMGGNDGGNATGHSGWLDPNHFYLMDRYRNSIFVYKINEDYPPYTVTLTDTFITNTSAHSLNPAEPRHLLSTNVFYIAVEGSVASKDNVVPRVIKVTFDRVSGTLHEEAFLEFPGATVDSRLHHFGINPSGTLMGVPLSDVNNTGNDVAYVVDLDTFTIINQYDVGLGAGHCDFSDSRNILCVTNHYDNFVSLIDMNNDTVTNINISSETPSWGSYIQSHRNWVTKDGNFFYMFETKIGTFLEFELLNLTLNRSTVTGGTPIQSTS
jgi:hypothetical protein